MNMVSSRSSRRVPLAVVTVVLLAGCVAGASPSPSPVPFASPTPTPAASILSPAPSSPTPSSVPTASPAVPSSSASPAACTLPLPGPLASDTLTGATLEADRLVFTFGSRPPEAIAQPVIGTTFVEPPFSMAGSGQPVSVTGGRFLKIRMGGMVVARPNGDPVFTGDRDLRLAGGTIPQAVMVDESEGVVTWIVGLSGSGCPTISRDTSGERLVVRLAG